MDHLFDCGFISFQDDGGIIVSPVAHRESLKLMGLDTERIPNIRPFTSGQRKFMLFHRENILLMSTFMDDEIRKTSKRTQRMKRGA
jgi:hypothetical protein